MFWSRKKNVVDHCNGVMNFRKYHKPSYNNYDLDVALETILKYEDHMNDRNERIIKAAVKIAESWKQWLIDKGVNREITVVVQRFDNPVVYPKVTLRVDSDTENEVFDIEFVATNYNRQVLKVADFYNKLMREEQACR